MKNGKLIAFEGTDCSGKETQSFKLYSRLKDEGKSVDIISFPKYESPIGKIVGGCLQGKPSIGESFFENPAILDPKFVSLFYAADRRYHLNELLYSLSNNEFVILDRYTYSSMAHQGGKLSSEEERRKFFEWLEKLEFELLNLPKPDVTTFLYMPYEYACILKKQRKELDLVEMDDQYLKHSEKVYLELAKIYNFFQIDCVKNNQIRTIDDIHEDVYKLIKK